MSQYYVSADLYVPILCFCRNPYVAILCFAEGRGRSGVFVKPILREAAGVFLVDQPFF